MSEGVRCPVMNVQSSGSKECGGREFGRKCDLDIDPCAEGDDDNAGANVAGNDCGMMTEDGRC